jgi:hypothetical protein
MLLTDPVGSRACNAHLSKVEASVAESLALLDQVSADRALHAALMDKSATLLLRSYWALAIAARPIEDRERP